jgi:glucose/arabinose dehydrogenase
MKFQVLKFILLLFLLVNYPNLAQYNFEIAFSDLTFSNPLDFQNANDGSDRIFIVEQAGKIKVFPNQTDVSTTKTFLDITSKVTTGGETGLLGLAFHPNYKQNGYFYVNYTAPNPLRTVVSRFKVSDTNSDIADINSEQILLIINQPYSNHNGGCLAFGLDGYLYIGTGDGGDAGDPQNRSQNINNLLGKILRIDVDNPQSPLNYGIPSDNPFIDSSNTNIQKEIFAWGLRNPWRFSFDYVSGNLWCGDVGQNAWEEVDIIDKGKNYGWRCYEGSHPYNIINCNGTYEDPIWEYSHALGISITGGYVYRGQNISELYGKYIYGDYGSARIWALEYDGINPATNSLITTAEGSITSFGVDESNELYLVSFDGKIYKFKSTVSNVTRENSLFNFNLFQNYPNPFNPSTKIRYSVPNINNQATIVSLKVYDILGNEVAVLVEKEQSPGTYEIVFDPYKINKSITSGIYFYKLTTSSYSESKKMMLLK